MSLALCRKLTHAMLSCAVILILFEAALAHGELIWEKPSQEFYRTPEDRELLVNFAFKNDGATPVRITNVEPSCRCTTAEVAKKVYLPGETGTVRVKYAFEDRRGLQSKSVTVSTDDHKATQLEFKCWIRQDPVVIRLPLLFWQVGETANRRRIDLTVTPEVKVKVTSVKSSNPRILATLTTVTEGEKYAVNIRPVDTAQPESAEVFIQTDFPPDEPKAYKVQVRIK